MRTFSNLIDELGGYLKLSEVLNLPRGTVSAMKTRNSIPPEHWPAIAREAERVGIEGVTLDSLAELRGPRQRRTKTEAGELA